MILEVLSEDDWNNSHLSLYLPKNKPQYLFEFIWINTLSTVYPISNLSAIQMTKEWIHNCTNLATTVQFPPRALSGSSNMLLVSAAVLVSWDGGVFFDLWGAFMTVLTVLDEKMSSVKNREICQLKNRTDSVKSVEKKTWIPACVRIVSYPYHHRILTWSLPLSWTSVLV